MKLDQPLQNVPVDATFNHMSRAVRKKNSILGEKKWQNKRFRDMDACENPSYVDKSCFM